MDEDYLCACINGMCAYVCMYVCKGLNGEKRRCSTIQPKRCAKSRRNSRMNEKWCQYELGHMATVECTAVNEADDQLAQLDCVRAHPSPPPPTAHHCLSLPHTPNLTGPPSLCRSMHRLQSAVSRGRPQHGRSRRRNQKRKRWRLAAAGS